MSAATTLSPIEKIKSGNAKVDVRTVVIIALLSFGLGSLQHKIVVSVPQSTVSTQPAAAVSPTTLPAGK